jgi:hypothetical protein
MCGYCMNAWDMIYMRRRSGITTPAAWIGYCRVGGCDPDVWDFLDDTTGWPKGFVFKPGDGGHVDWEKTIKKYKMPEPDNRVYHRRFDDSDGAAWRRNSARMTAAFHAVRLAKTDENGALKDELIVWDDDEAVEVVADDEIEW